MPLLKLSETCGNLLTIDEAVGMVESLFHLFKSLKEVTLTGEIVCQPYPILTVGRRMVRGPSIDDFIFKELKPLPNDKQFLSVDASFKPLFDCGSFKVIVVKSAAVVWRWRKPVRRFKPYKQYVVALKRVEVEEALLVAELRLASRVSEILEEGDYCVLDRPLMAVPALKEDTRRFMESFDRELGDKGIVVMGVCKSSKMKLNTGEPLLGYLNFRSSYILKGRAWWYYPLFKSSQYPSWYVGEPCAVKFDGGAEHVLRVDVGRRALKKGYLEAYLGELSFLQDAATPGYPYPIRGAHEEAKLSRYEIEIDKLIFLERLRKKGLMERFLADVRSASFREEAFQGLWI